MKLDKNNKKPNNFTIDYNSKVFERRDYTNDAGITFDDFKFLGGPEENEIKDSDGKLLIDLAFYRSNLNKDITSRDGYANPELARNVKGQSECGLFEIIPGKIYQIRNLDIANIQFIKSKTG
jgi:alkyl sulfatase BDS1-like metallo-beta-lactamase superfamily hydrolase